MLTPQILAAAFRAAANALEGVPHTAGSGAGVASLQLPPPVVVTPPVNPAVTITEDQLTGLIMPHVGNDAIKLALGAVMRANGIDQLPNAQPHQYPMLYAAFQGVLAQHGIGGPAPQTTAAPNII